MVTRVGRAVLLSVIVYSNPAPKIQWMRGNIPVQLDARVNQLLNGTLKICDADSADAGNYTISATNSLSASAATLEITCCGELDAQYWTAILDMLYFEENWDATGLFADRSWGRERERERELGGGGDLTRVVCN